MKFGIYNTDGEYQHGDLKDYSELAIALDTSTVALYLKINGLKVIFGTSVNLHIGRSDTLLFIAEENIRSLTGETLRNFFTTAITEFEKLGYTIENIANEKDFYDKIKKTPFRTVTSKETTLQPAQYTAVKLLLNEPVFVVSPDPFYSVSFIVEIIKTIQDALSLSPGFVFVSSRKTFRDTDISILPGKPSTIDIEDVNLNPVRIVNTRDIDKYDIIFKKFLSFQKVIPSAPTSRSQVLQNIIVDIFKGLPTLSQRRDWISFAKKHQISIEYTVKDSVIAILEGDQLILKGYFPLSESKAHDLVQEINSLSPEKQTIFFQEAEGIFREDKQGKKILDAFSYRNAVYAIESVVKTQKNLGELQKYLKSKLFYPDNFKRALSELKKEDFDLFLRSSESNLKSYRDAYKIILELRPPSAATAIKFTMQGSSVELESYFKYNFDKNEFYKEILTLPDYNFAVFEKKTESILPGYPQAQSIINELKKQKAKEKRDATVKNVTSMIFNRRLILPLLVIIIAILIGILIITPEEIAFVKNNPVHSLIFGPPVSAPPENTSVQKTPEPVASFTFNNLTGLDVQFNAGQDNTIKKWWWSFGDRELNQGTNNTIHHKYAEPGDYPVSLRVSEDGTIWSPPYESMINVTSQ